MIGHVYGEYNYFDLLLVFHYSEILVYLRHLGSDRKV